MDSRSEDPIAMAPFPSKAVKRQEREREEGEEGKEMQKPKSLGNRRVFLLSFVCMCVSATMTLDKMNKQRVFQAKIAKEFTGIYR